MSGIMVSVAPEEIMWLNGQLVPVGKAQVSVLSPTCQFGANVFEGIRGYWNHERGALYLFRAGDHWARLTRSIRLMRFEGDWSSEILRNAVTETIQANGLRGDLEVRQTVFLDGMGSWHATGPTGMFVRARSKVGTAADECGLHCCISSWERIGDRSFPPRIKMGANYMNSRLAHLEARQNGYDTAILLNRSGTVSEAPGSCVYILRDGRLVTPPGSASILESITRATVKEIAETEFEIEVVEREIDRTELYVADEILLCGTAMEIKPVLSVDRLLINAGTPGPITTNLRTKYFEIVRGMDDHYAGWLTPVPDGAIRG